MTQLPDPTGDQRHLGRTTPQPRWSGRHKPPLSCPSGLYSLKGCCSIGNHAKYRPWRRTSGRGAEVGGQSDTGVIYSGRPTLIAPPFRHQGDGRSVLDLLGDSFHNEIELVSRNAQGAAWIAGEILPLPSLLSGLEPEDVIDPECTDTRHVRTAVLIDRRQPASVPIRSASTGGLSHPLCESVGDAVPVKEWQLVEIPEVPGFHWRFTGRRVRGHRCRHSCPLATVWTTKARSLSGEVPHRPGGWRQWRGSMTP